MRPVATIRDEDPQQAIARLTAEGYGWAVYAASLRAALWEQWGILHAARCRADSYDLHEGPCDWPVPHALRYPYMGWE